jgi:hypothetical protein
MKHRSSAGFTSCGTISFSGIAVLFTTQKCAWFRGEKNKYPGRYYSRYIIFFGKFMSHRTHGECPHDHRKWRQVDIIALMRLESLLNSIGNEKESVSGVLYKPDCPVTKLVGLLGEI